MRDVRVEFYVLEPSTLTKFQANVDFRPSTKVKLTTDLFTFKLGDKTSYYRILFVFLTLYVLYYGFEKAYEVLKGQFGASQRLLINLLDFLSLYLAVFCIIYLNEILIYDQNELMVHFSTLFIHSVYIHLSLIIERFEEM